MSAERKQTDNETQQAKEEFLSDLTDLENRVNDTWEELDETRKRLNEDHKKLTEILNRYKNLNNSLNQLQSAYDDNEDDINLKQELDPTDEVDKRLKYLSKEMNIIHENKLRVGSLWLRFLVGRVSMKVWDDGTKLQLKTEYHKFKYRTNFIFLIFPILQLIWSKYYGSFSWVINQWHQIWLLYYYITLSTRELILKINGSKLHLWWIIHHQISSFGAFICLLIQRSAYERYWFLFELLPWMSLIVGGLQIWANKYQLKRHYVRLALGKDSYQDIALAESVINEKNAQSSLEFNLLKMASYMTYLLELSAGIGLIVFVYINDTANGHTFDLFQFEAYLCGICFVALGIGNANALHTRPSKYMSRTGSTHTLVGDATGKKMRRRSAVLNGSQFKKLE